MNRPATPPAPSSGEARRLRALAHPLRWKLIDVLSSERSATATRCAEVLGESVASCSYHLGILGKYGYIELVPDSPGRERPWRLASPRQDLVPSPGDRESELAAEAAAEAFLDHEVDRMKERLRRLSGEAAEWREATFAGGSTIYVSASELRQLSEELKAVLVRYEDRDDPGARPPGAREARIFASTSVAPEP